MASAVGVARPPHFLATPTPTPISNRWSSPNLSPRWSGIIHPPLVAKLSQHLGAMVPLLNDKTRQLKWSLNFHKNMLFGQYYSAVSHATPLVVCV